MNDTDAAEAHRQLMLHQLARMEEQVQAMQLMIRELLEHVRRIAGKQMQDD